MNSKDHARRQELQSLVDSCCRDDYVSSDCLSSHSLGQQCDAWSELMACDAKIAQMEEELINIYRSRFLLKEEVNRSHDKLLRKIPAEVISHIFDFNVNAKGENGDVPAAFKTMSSLLTLYKVSKAWGELVHTMPRLWATIGVRVHNSSKSTDMQFIRTWLNRSGEVPLFIAFTFGYTENCRPEKLSLSLEMLEGCIHRWHHLTMDIHNDRICEDFFKYQIQENLALLESLQIEFYGHKIGPNLQNFLRQTSCLKYIKMSQLKSLSDDIKWISLTRLEIRELTWNVFFQILHFAPCLVQCDIGMTPTPPDHAPPVTALVHSVLKCFQVRIKKYDPLQRIYLEKLRLPSLMDFVYDAHRVGSDSIYDFRSMIVDSQCPITRASLIIYSYSASDEAGSGRRIMDLLGVLPALTHLTFAVTFADKSLLDRLAADVQGLFLPHLESLEVRHFSLYKSALANIADALDPNGRPGEIEVVHQRPLRHAIFRVDWSHRLLELVNLDEEAFLRLVRVKNSGLSLKLLDHAGEDIFQRPEIATRFMLQQ